MIFLSNMLSKSIFPFEQLDHHQNCNIKMSGKMYVYHLSYTSLPLDQFPHCRTFISDLRSPLKISKRRSVKRQKQYPILAECLIQSSREAEEKKEKYYSFFLSPCVTPLLFQIISHHSLSCDLTAAFDRWKNTDREQPIKCPPSRFPQLPYPKRGPRHPLPKPLGFFTMNRNLRWHLRIASTFHTLALETMSEAWETRCRKSPAFQCLEDLAGLDRGSVAEGHRSLVQLAGPPGPIAHSSSQIRDQLPKHLHPGIWQTLHKSAVSPRSALEGVRECQLHSSKSTKFDF